MQIRILVLLFYWLSAVSTAVEQIRQALLRHFDLLLFHST